MSNRFRRVAVLAIIVVVVAAGAGTAVATSGSAPVYRLGTVAPSDVTAALHEVGTLNPVHQADVPFAVSGTVTSVAVQPGQAVRAGQKLGSLDTTALRAQLTAAQSTLASANLQVHNDEASENSAASSQPSGSASSGSGSSKSAPSKSAPSKSVPSAASLRSLQQAVVAAQRRVDGLLAQAEAALAQAKQACAPPAGTGPTPTPTPTASATPAPPTSPAPTAPPSPTPSATSPAAANPSGTGSAALDAAADGPSPSPAPPPSPPSCAVAEQRVLSLEADVLRAQQALSGRLTALASALARAVAGSGTSGHPSTTGDPTTTSDPSTASDPSGGGQRSNGGGSGGVASAAQLAADQAAADAAAAQVTVAQQNLAAATLVSPVSGTVTAVDVAAGASASAGSTAFVIAGLDSYDVVALVPVTDMPVLKVGQQASVLPDGTSTPVGGTVVAIGLIPYGTGSPPVYPVTIGLTGQPQGLRSGGFASVTITTARSSGVSVPTSAVHGSGRSATVTVYAGGQTRVAKVKVGTMGPVMTRIISGLRVGQKVVLANLNQPLPNNNVPNQGPPGRGNFVFGGPQKVRVFG